MESNQPHHNALLLTTALSSTISSLRGFGRLSFWQRDPRFAVFSLLLVGSRPAFTVDDSEDAQAEANVPGRRTRVTLFEQKRNANRGRNPIHTCRSLGWMGLCVASCERKGDARGCLLLHIGLSFHWGNRRCHDYHSKGKQRSFTKVEASSPGKPSQ